MGKINRLPIELSNQIAAGEVVERPASVVKELIENALDAGATRISVGTEQGGKALVRVEDDGEGMDPDDAWLCLERHATSKVQSAGDLAAIATLGFRGEALPSIASVSRLTLRTRRGDQTAGTEVRVDGGVPASRREVGARQGTRIEVADLFFNLPARRKFLKADAAESAQVSRVVTQIALAYPEVGFALTSGSRLVLEWPPVAGMADRFFQVYGERPDLAEVRWDAGAVSVRGYVAALAEQGPTRGPQHVWINRRVVKDRTIAHAVLDAYTAASMKERSPEVHLFIDMPPDEVDVNVHPTKAEVRFREPSAIHGVVRRAVAAALGEGPAPTWQLAPSAAVTPPAFSPGLPGLFGGVARPWTSPPEPDARAGVEAVAPPGGQVSVASGGRVLPMAPLGQFRHTYIIAIDAEGIAIIDQHVAHERVLFERVMERLSSGRLESQRLLEPLLIALPPGSRDAIASNEESLDRLGFEMAPFGGDTVRVTAVPALLSASESMAAVRAVAEDLEGLGRHAAVGEALRRLAATTACHAAVKANAPLTFEKMAHILDELRRTAYSTVCPHGRPVMLRLTRREIEKNFERI